LESGFSVEAVTPDFQCGFSLAQYYTRSQTNDQQMDNLVPLLCEIWHTAKFGTLKRWWWKDSWISRNYLLF